MQTIGDMMGDRLSVQMFAALAAADDWGPAFQAAINQLRIASPKGGGIVFVPAGDYPDKTTVVKPRNITLAGTGAFGGTRIYWTQTSGVAFVEGDDDENTLDNGAPALTTGGFRDLHIIGPGKTHTADGILVGNDPAGVIVPTAYLANRTVWSGVVIQNFRDGIRWGDGQNAYGNLLLCCVLVNNKVGMHMLSGVGGPIPLNMIGGMFCNNEVSIKAEASGSTYRFTVVNFEYTGPVRNYANNNFEFTGCHLEKSNVADPSIDGPFIEDAGGTCATGVIIRGGFAVMSNAFSGFTGTDPYFLSFTGSVAQLDIDGLTVVAVRPATCVVNNQAADTGRSLTKISAYGDSFGVPKIAALVDSLGPNVLAVKNGMLERRSGCFAVDVADVGGPGGLASTPTIWKGRAQTGGYLHLASYWNSAREAWGIFIDPLTVPSISGDTLGRIGMGIGAGSPTTQGTAHISGGINRIFDARHTPSAFGPTTGDGGYTGEVAFDNNWLFLWTDGDNTGGHNTIKRAPLMIRGTAASLPAPSAAVEGAIQPVYDCNTNVLGAAVAGGGGHHVMAYCDGSAWVVAAVAGGSAPLSDVGTPGTYTKVTTDAKGRVTAGASLSASDLPAGTIVQVYGQYQQGLSASIGATTITVPAAGGEYDLGISLSVASLGTGNASVTASWTEGGIVRSQTFGPITLATWANRVIVVAPLHVDAGTNVSYSTAWTSSGSYSLAVTLRGRP